MSHLRSFQNNLTAEYLHTTVSFVGYVQIKMFIPWCSTVPELNYASLLKQDYSHG